MNPDVILHQQWVGLTLLLALVGIAWLNRRFCPVLDDFPPQPGGPRISILVPARNEAENIATCVHSLMEQRYPNLEVIVLDDESEDETPHVLQALQRQYPTLRVLTGRPLPAGWMGKNWACHQLAQNASGEYLLFTDGDTVHHPDCAARTIAIAETLKADLLTGLPDQRSGSWGEHFVLPFLRWGLTTLVPHFLAKRLPWPGLTVGVGQFLIFRREAYDRLGGHRAVRGAVVEDVMLARRAQAADLRVIFADLRGWVACRMYHDWRSVVQGFTKNMYAFFGAPLPMYLFAWLWMWWLFVFPMAGLLLAALDMPLPGFQPRLAWAAMLLSWFLWAEHGREPDTPWAVTLLYPVTVTLFVLIALRSAWVTVLRRPLVWKGRLISP